MWFIEEVGELATALASGDKANQAEEFADVLAWLCTLANISDIDLEKAIEKYTTGQIEGFKPK
jgi:NTP pyrophosphatase (non-canonical NTP hydrolase)